MSDTRKPDLLDNMFQRTDNDFNGVRDDSLIGQDLPDDEDEESDEDELPAETSKVPKSL